MNTQEILGATTNAVSTVKSLSNVASATSLSGIAEAIPGAIGDTVSAISKNISKGIDSISSGFENILSSVDSGEEESDLELPLPNILHNYATYNYIFGLYCLDTDSYNYPGSSYMAGKLPPIICKSASLEPDNRIKLAGGGKYDFFIDEVVINSYASFTTQTGNTNQNTIEFTVTEPYSMGMFMQSLQIAAFNQKYINWLDAAFLLTIEFKGNTETGKMESVPNTKKFIPIKFQKCHMKMNESGSIYTVTAYAASGEALNDGYTTLMTDTTITGKTVQEILQSGSKSLQQAINTKYTQIKKTGSVNVQDEVLILFPINISTDGAGATLVKQGNTESKSSATQDPTQINDAALFKTLGISRSGTSSSLVQNNGTCNALGKAKLGFDVNRGGQTPFPNENAVWDDSKKIWERSAVQSNPNIVDFKFPQGSNIIDAINQVLLKSEIAISALDPKQISADGFRPWWRIDTQVYHIKSDENFKKTGSIPKLIVYRIIPYKVHSSKMLPPNATAIGLQKLKDQIVKEYNYIYTGKNIDLLKFDFEISETFHNPYMADNFKNSGDVVTAQQTGNAMAITPTEAAQATPKTPIGTYNSDPTVPVTQTKHNKIITSSDNKAGSIGDTMATKAAKLFHDAVINPNEMTTINFDIIGDPYYISNSGTGNYTDTQLKFINITKDGSINYMNGEAHVIINFRTPIDINQKTGFFDFTNTKLCQQFSGIFRLSLIKSQFSKGVFKQSIEAYRTQGQDSSEPANPDSILSSDQIPDNNKGIGIANFLGSNDFTKKLDSITEDFTSKIQSTIDNTASVIDKAVPTITGLIK
jgi:uncharacterized protein YaaQ